MLSSEGVENVKKDLLDCIRGLGWSATTVVLASLEAAIAKHSSVSHVSNDMVRRKELEEMYNEMQVLKGQLKEKDKHIQDLLEQLAALGANKRKAPKKAKKDPSGGMDLDKDQS
mgnify:CR=1 FL=1